MLRKWFGQQQTSPYKHIDTLIGPATEVKGDVLFSGGLRVDGRIIGNVRAQTGHPEATLVLSGDAAITGNVEAPHMVINGRVDGNLFCAERLELQAGAVVTGDASYKVVIIAAGARVSGRLLHADMDPCTSTDSNEAARSPPLKGMEGGLKRPAVGNSS